MVLAGKGSLRRAKTQGTLVGCVPFWPDRHAAGGSAGSAIKREFAKTRDSRGKEMEQHTTHNLFR